MGGVWARAAALLGVPEAKLVDAFAQAHNQALDDAVKAGYLTQAQADAKAAALLARSEELHRQSEERSAAAARRKIEPPK